MGSKEGQKARVVFDQVLGKDKLSDKELEAKIRSKDPELRLLLLRSVQTHYYQRLKKHVWIKLTNFANRHNLDRQYLSAASFLNYSKSQVDGAASMLFNSQSTDDVKSRTGVEKFLVESMTSLKFLFTDDVLQQSLYEMFKRDFQIEITKVLEITKAEALKKLTLKDLRVIDFLKKDNIRTGLQVGDSMAKIFCFVRPLLISYIQAALPLQEIYKQIISEVGMIELTVQDMFDLVLIGSECDARGLMLESYSEFYPVPLAIQIDLDGIPRLMHELAYFLEPTKAVLSFGLWRAEILKCGKSKLVDKIFSTNFSYKFQGSGSSQAQSSRPNTFDFGRIDIQLPRNIDSLKPETRWSVIDVSRFANYELIS